MREILFRGKRLDNGEWVEGWYIHTKRYHCIITGCIDDGYVVYGHYASDVEMYVVDPSTVGQFTGLCDKNGKKAFGHDVTEDNTGRKWIIFDCPGGFGICRTTEWIRNGHELHNGLSETQNAEWFAQNHSIIGNNHDNPELLEDVGR